MIDGVAEEESGGGVMLVFSNDPTKQPDVEEALRYIVRALTAHHLQVTEHRADPKTMEHRCALLCIVDVVCGAVRNRGCMRGMEIAVTAAPGRLDYMREKSGRRNLHTRDIHPIQLCSDVNIGPAE